MLLQEIQDIVERVIDQPEGSFERYESDDGRSVTFTSTYTEDGYRDCQISSDGGKEMNTTEAAEYMDESFVLQDDLFDMDDYIDADDEPTTENSENLQNDSNIQSPLALDEDTEDEVVNATEVDLVKNEVSNEEIVDGEEIFGNDMTENETVIEEVPLLDIDGDTLAHALGVPTEFDSEQEKPELHVDIASLLHKPEGTASDKNDLDKTNISNGIMGLTKEQRIELGVAQEKAGFIPFEARGTKEVDAKRAINSDYGKILGIDTTRAITAKEDKENANITYGIKIPYAEFKELLPHNIESKFEEKNINKITATKQYGGVDRVEVPRHNGDKSPLRIGVTNLVTLDVEFKDKSHMTRTLVMDDIGMIRGVLTFNENLEIPIREEIDTVGEGEEIKTRSVLLDIPSLNMLDIDNPRSFIKNASAEEACDIQDRAFEKIDEVVASKLEEFKEIYNDKESYINARVNFFESQLDYARNDLGKNELIVTKAKADELRCEGKTIEKLEAYNDAVKNLKESNLDKESSEYKTLANKVESAKVDFLNEYKKASEEIKAIDLKSKIDNLDRAADKYNNCATNCEKEQNAKEKAYGKLEDIGNKMGKTSWSEKLEAGIPIDNNRAFYNLCATESAQTDKTLLSVGNFVNPNTIADYLETCDLGPNISKEQKEAEIAEYRNSDVQTNDFVATLIDEYNKGVESDEDKMHIGEDGFVYDSKDNRIPIEGAQDEIQKRQDTELRLDASTGNSLEEQEKVFSRKELDDDAPAAKFLDWVAGGFDKSDFDRLKVGFEDRTQSIIDVKGNALDEEEKAALKKNLGDISHASGEIEKEKGDDTEKKQSSSMSIDKTFKRGMSGNYGKVDVTKEVKISAVKEEQLKVEATAEARKELSGKENDKDYDKLFTKKQEEIFEKKKEELKGELEQVSKTISKIEDSLDKFELPTKFLRNNLGFQIATNELDAQIKQYVDMGGAVGEGEFVIKGVSALERACGILDILQTNLIESAIFKTASFFAEDLRLDIGEVFRGPDVGNGPISIFTKMDKIPSDISGWVKEFFSEEKDNHQDIEKPERDENSDVENTNVSKETDVISQGEQSEKKIEQEQGDSSDNEKREELEKEAENEKLDVVSNKGAEDAAQTKMEKQPEEPREKEVDKNTEDKNNTENKTEASESKEQEVKESKDTDKEQNKETQSTIQEEIIKDEANTEFDSLESSPEEGVENTDTDDIQNSSDDAKTQGAVTDDAEDGDDIESSQKENSSKDEGETDSHLEDFKNDLEDVLNGNETIENVLDKHADEFAEGKITDDNIPDAFAEAVEESGVKDADVIADTATELAEVGNGPADSLLDKMFDALSDFCDFLSDCWEKAIDFIDGQEFETSCDATDGSLDFTEDGEVLNAETIVDESGIIGDEITESVIPEISNGLESLMENVDVVADIAKDVLTEKGFPEDVVNSAVDTIHDQILEVPNAGEIGTDELLNSLDLNNIAADVMAETGVTDVEMVGETVDAVAEIAQVLLV